MQARVAKVTIQLVSGLVWADRAGAVDHHRLAMEVDASIESQTAPAPTMKLTINADSVQGRLLRRVAWV